MLQEGFSVETFFSGLPQPTNMALSSSGDLYVTTLGDGSVHVISGQSSANRQEHVFASGFSQPLGLAFYNGALYVSSRGEVTMLRDTTGSGVANSSQVIISGLPNGRHQNDSIVFGPDGKLYLGNGSTCDLCQQASPLSAAILSANADGSNLEVYASGLRNPYGLAFNRLGDLFATDNGPDFTPAPDELNYIVKGGNYGFPNYFGTPPPGTNTIGPVALFEDHAAVTGLTFYNGSQFPTEYQDNAFVTEWGAIYGSVPAGHKLVRVQLQRTDGQYKDAVSDFMTGLQNPIDVLEAPDGSLLVADYGTGTIYRIFYNS